MIINCPECGKELVIKGFGRRPLNIGFTKVCETLQHHSSCLAAAESLGCSVSYIYKVLGEKGEKPKDVLSNT